MSTTQTKRMKLEKAAAIQAEAKVAEEVANAVRRSRYVTPPGITAADIVRERETNGLAWKRVALNLGLKNGSHARKLYEELTGKPHQESNALLQRASKRPQGVALGKTTRPQWDDDTDQDYLIDELTGSVILVRREFRGITLPEEQVVVKRIVAFLYDGPDQDGPLCVTVVDRETEAHRTFRVRDIAEVM